MPPSVDDLLTFRMVVQGRCTERGGMRVTMLFWYSTGVVAFKAALDFTQTASIVI